MTQLAIISNFDKKTAKFEGVIAAGEKVSVVLKNALDEVANIATLRLRAVGFRGETLAQFPMPESEDAWTIDEGTSDISCVLNLNTTQMLLAVPPAATMRILFVLDDAEYETLYFKAFAGVEHWPRKTGEEEPVDLGGYADFVKETKQVLSEAEVAIEEARANASSAATSSAASATAAEEALDAAVESQGSAANSATAAQEARNEAESASSYATKAAQVAQVAQEAAETAKVDAESARDEAKGYAESAESVLANAATKDELAAEVERATKAESALGERVSANESAIATAQTTASDAQGKANTLIGNDSGKSARTIAGEEVAKIVGGAPAAYDTLKEISDYIESDKTGAAAMAASIAENKSAIEELDGAKQDKLTAGENITIEDGVISAKGGGGGVNVDSSLSSTSMNPIQNQWLGKRLGATASNSVQIGYDAKAGRVYGQAVDGSSGDDGYQVAVGHSADGTNKGTAVGYNAVGSGDGTAVGYYACGAISGVAVGDSTDGSNSGSAVGLLANGSYSGAAVGRDANGSYSGAAVGCGAKTNSVEGAVAVGYKAQANSDTPIVIGGSQLANTAQITVSRAGVLKVGGKEVAKKSEVWLVGGDESHNTAFGAKLLGLQVHRAKDGGTGRIDITDTGSGISLAVSTDGLDFTIGETGESAYRANRIDYIYLIDGEEETSLSATLPDIINTANGENTAYAPRYPFATATVESGVLTLAPYAVSQLTSDGTAFTVTMGGEAGTARDCVFVVDCSSLETAPTVTWGENFHPRTDAATDFACVAGATNVYWITEYAEGQFAVAGWQVTAGGSEVSE